MIVSAIITLKKDVLDPQGKVIHQTLDGMGFKDVNEVRQGKYFEIDVNGDNLIISENGKTRNIYPHSILRGVQTLPDGHINYRKLESIEVDENSIITVPFELLNNSPHIAFEIMKTEITPAPC